MVDRGIQRHAAPAGTDLQQMIVGLQIELRADALQLVQLGLLRLCSGVANMAAEYIMVGSRKRSNSSLPSRNARRYCAANRRGCCGLASAAP